MDNAYAIWHHEKNERISDLKELVGVFIGTWQDADKLVDDLNAADDEKPLFGRNYWKEEIQILTNKGG